MQKLSLNGAWTLFDGDMDLSGNYMYNNTRKEVLEQTYKETYMQDGSTLDLSAWAGGWPVASGFTSGNTAIRFADGATVKVKVGASRVGSARGTKILGWTTAPANVDFVPAEGERIGLRKKDDGLYLYKGLIILVR